MIKIDSNLPLEEILKIHFSNFLEQPSNDRLDRLKHVCKVYQDNKNNYKGDTLEDTYTKSYLEKLSQF